eukprot:jgi/Psemu1/46678/gm1.46678_g
MSYSYDFDQESIDKVEYKNTQEVNGSQEVTKIKIPLITAGSTKLQILFTINEFIQSKKMLNLTTGPRIYDKFVDLLRDYTD